MGCDGLRDAKQRISSGVSTWFDAAIETFNKKIGDVDRAKHEWEILISRSHYCKLADQYHKYVQGSKQENALRRLSDEVDVFNFTLAEAGNPKEWGFSDKRE